MEVFDYERDTGFSKPIWLDILNEEEIPSQNVLKQELEVSND